MGIDVVNFSLVKDSLQLFAINIAHKALASCSRSKCWVIACQGNTCSEDHVLVSFLELSVVIAESLELVTVDCESLLVHLIVVREDNALESDTLVNELLDN